MTRLVVRVGVMLMVTFAGLVVTANIAGNFMPYEGEIRYFVWENNINNVYVMDAMRGTTFRSLTLGDFYRSSWLPDYQYILVQGKSGGTYLIDVNNNAPFLLFSEDVYPYWSPDGSRLIFLDYVGTSPNVYRQIYIANADGTNPQLLTPDDGADYADPAWSPDGSQLAYTRNGDLYVMSLLDNSATRLTNTVELEAFPDWSPDGQRIAFLRGEFQSWQLSVIDSDGQNHVDFNIDHIGSFTWSPNNTQLSFYAVGETGSHVYIVDIYERTEQMLPSEYPLNVSVGTEWQENNTVLRILWFELDTAGNAGFSYQDEIAVLTGELLSREQRPSNYRGTSPDGRWFFTYEYSRGELCVLTRETREIHHCSPISNASQLVWLP